MKRVLVSLLLLGFASALLAGCNTIEGVGKDVKRAGEAVEEAADKARD